MNAQERTRFLIKHIEENAYLNRMADGLTGNMFSAIWFHTKEEAERWMQGIYAPKEPGYEITETNTRIWEVEEHEQSKGSTLPEDS